MDKKFNNKTEYGTIDKVAEYVLDVLLCATAISDDLKKNEPDFIDAKMICVLGLLDELYNKYDALHENAEELSVLGDMINYLLDQLILFHKVYLLIDSIDQFQAKISILDELMRNEIF